MKQAFIYARVSTEEQAKEGQSIEAQLSMCRRHADNNDIKILQTFVDEGKSATNINRPALQDMLGQITEQNIDFILIQDTDRLARNTLDHLTIKGLLKKHDVVLIAINQPLIDDSPEGNLIDTMLAATNAFQSQITGRKTSKVLESKAEFGWYPGGVPPLGYRNVDNPAPESNVDRRIIAIDESEAPHIRKIFQLYSGGNTNIKQLVQYLNDMGVKSPQSKSDVGVSLIARTLQNPFYIGSFHWKNQIYKGKHDTFIDDDLFNKVQEVLAVRNLNRSRTRKHNMLLRGFLFYEPSDKLMWGEIKQKGDKEYKHYFCPDTKKGSYTPADDIEKAVQKLFGTIEITEQYKNEILETAKKLLKEFRDTKQDELARLQRERAKLEKAISEAEDDRYIRHVITTEAYNRITDKYKPLLENIESEIAKLDVDHSERMKSLERILDLAENLETAYFKAEKPYKRELLAMFFSKIYVKDKKIVKYDLAPEVEDLIQNGSVRVRATGLERWETFRKIDWLTYLEYPEFITKEVTRFLKSY